MWQLVGELPGHSEARLGGREWRMSHLAPLVAPSSSVLIWIFTILLLPQLSLQEEGLLHPTKLSLSTESPESASWAAEHEKGDVGREVETRTGSEGIYILTMTMEEIEILCFYCKHMILF